MKTSQKISFSPYKVLKGEVPEEFENGLHGCLCTWDVTSLDYHYLDFAYRYKQSIVLDDGSTYKIHSIGKSEANEQYNCSKRIIVIPIKPLEKFEGEYEFYVWI